MDKLPIFTKAGSQNIHFAGRRRISSQVLLYLYLCFTLILFFVLILRLFQLTIVKGNYYRQLSEDNRIRELLLESKRGKIIDRKAMIIAENNPADQEKNAARLTSPRIYHSNEEIAHLIGY